MDKTLNEFIHALRGAGVRISTAEAMDAARALQLTGYTDRSHLRDALAATLAKTNAENATFLNCFEQFFNATNYGKSETPAKEQPSTRQKQSKTQDGQAQETAPPQSPLAQLLLSGDQGAIQAAFAQAGAAAEVAKIRMITQKGLYGRRLMMAMGLGALEEELWKAEASNSASQQALARALRDAREHLRSRARQYVEREFMLQAAQAQRELSEEILMDLSLNQLQDFTKLLPLVQKLAKRLVAMHHRQRREAIRGRLDFRKTLRHSIPHDGTIVHLYWKTRKVDRPALMVLCDVSGSVAASAKFLLMFLYAMAEVIPKMRAFAFSSQLGEVTELFDSLPLEKAIAQTMARYGMGSSDYGRSLEDFTALTKNNIDRRTTLIILGDARNNNADPRLDLWEPLCRKAGRVYWLNPEDRTRWGSGDSEMPAYQTWITQACECRNLKQLERFAATLLKASQ
ncbi:Conserved hypothetical protein [gamma proteobacterium HdN1]|nr:Conserved hypothetical protein [gamma proteobacterium HdN1]